MTGIKDNINNQKLVDVCMWDPDDIRVMLVTSFEVFCLEECLKDKFMCGGNDAKTMGEQKNELA